MSAKPSLFCKPLKCLCVWVIVLSKLGLHNLQATNIKIVSTGPETLSQWELSSMVLLQVATTKQGYIIAYTEPHLNKTLNPRIQCGVYWTTRAMLLFTCSWSEVKLVRALLDGFWFISQPVCNTPSGETFFPGIINGKEKV